MFGSPIAGQQDTYALPSLRAAVEAANAHAGADTIRFAPSLASQTITLTRGQLTIADTSGPTILDGADARLLQFSGNHASHVFDIAHGASAVISSWSIAHGKAATDGGGIVNSGSLVVRNSTLWNNSAEADGGISNRGALTVVDATLQGNAAPTRGGTLQNFGPLTLTNCTVAANSAQGAGAGIANFATAKLNNTIVADSANAAGLPAADLDRGQGGTFAVSYSLIEIGGNAGSAEISVPLISIIFLTLAFLP